MCYGAVLNDMLRAFFEVYLLVQHARQDYARNSPIGTQEHVCLQIGFNGKLVRLKSLKVRRHVLQRHRHEERLETGQVLLSEAQLARRQIGLLWTPACLL